MWGSFNINLWRIALDSGGAYESEAFEKRMNKRHKLHARIRQAGHPKKDDNE
jgi:hypothetical protein